MIDFFSYENLQNNLFSNFSFVDYSIRWILR